jgi:hypothetical protein
MIRVTVLLLAGLVLLQELALERPDQLVVMVCLGLIGLDAASLADKWARPPKPKLLVPQATLELESQIRAVQVEFLHRPLTEESIAELESELWLALTRSNAPLFGPPQMDRIEA